MRSIYIDVETVGLTGDLVSIQWSVDREKPKIATFKECFRGFDPNILNGAKVIAYNLPFDLWHLYRYFKPAKPWGMLPVDLLNSVKMIHPFAFRRSPERSSIIVRKVPRVCVSILLDELGRRLPNVQYKHHVHGTGDIVNVSFTSDYSMSLKALYGGESYHFGKMTPEQMINDKTFVEYALRDIELLYQCEDDYYTPLAYTHDEVSHIVAYTRWKGFEFDERVLSKGIEDYEEAMRADFPFNPRSSVQALKYFQEIYPNIKSTSHDDLKKLAEFDDVANKLMDYRQAKQRRDQALKILRDGCHPEFRVMGTPTYRLSGSGGLNWQGVAKGTPMREAVKCAAVGDFDAMEMTIAAAVYYDKVLMDDIANGMDTHQTTADTIGCDRSTGKRINFAILYGAGESKIASILGCSMDEAKKALDRFYARYTGVAETRRKLEHDFLTLDTTTWKMNPMKTEIMNVVSEKRSFLFEKMFCDAFFDLSKDYTVNWGSGSYVRRDEKGSQTYDKAMCSALLGATLGIQQNVFRQAANYLIQSVGAYLTKSLQVNLWHRTGDSLMNIHDEIVARSWNDDCDGVVKMFLKVHRQQIPSLNIEFKKVKRWVKV